MSFQETLSPSTEQHGIRPPVHVDGDPVSTLDSPLKDVPEDILVAFFKATLDHKGFPSVSLSHVSRRWREVSITTPPLWSKIVIAPDIEGHPLERNEEGLAALSKEEIALREEKEKHWKEGLRRIPERVAVYLQRSENSPLHISLHTSEWAYSQYASHVEQLHKSLVQLLHPSSHRWESVDFDISVQDFSSPLLPLIQMTPNRIPNVRSLRMKAECRNDMAFAMFFLPTDVPGLDLGTPLATTVGALRSASLTSLHVVGTSTQVIWKLPAPWATLTCLSIDGGRLPLPFTQLDAMSVMNSCPKLIECSLEFHQKRDMIFPISFQPPQPLPLHSITLPDLRALRLSGENPGVQGLPSRLVLPSLKSLSIAFSHSLYPSNSARSTNVEWIKEHGDKLSNATIVHASLIPSALLECLNGLPNVVDLTLLGTSAGEGDEGDGKKAGTYPCRDAGECAQ